MDPDKLTPAQARVLDAIRTHGPISEGSLALELYGDASRTAPLQLPLAILEDATLVRTVRPPLRGEGSQGPILWRAYGQPS